MQNNRSQSQKSPSFKLVVSQNSNQTFNRSISQLRKVRRSNSQTLKKPQVVLQRVESPKAFGDSCNESLKENQDANKSQKSGAKKSDAPLNKSNLTINESRQSNIQESNSRKNLTDASNRTGEKSLRKSNASDVDIEENTAIEGVPSGQSSIETSSDGTPKTRVKINNFFLCLIFFSMQYAT